MEGDMEVVMDSGVITWNKVERNKLYRIISLPEGYRNVLDAGDICWNNNLYYGQNSMNKCNSESLEQQSFSKRRDLKPDKKIWLDEKASKEIKVSPIEMPKTYTVSVQYYNDLKHFYPVLEFSDRIEAEIYRKKLQNERNKYQKNYVIEEEGIKVPALRRIDHSPILKNSSLELYKDSNNLDFNYIINKNTGRIVYGWYIWSNDERRGLPKVSNITDDLVLHKFVIFDFCKMYNHKIIKMDLDNDYVSINVNGKIVKGTLEEISKGRAYLKHSPSKKGLKQHLRYRNINDGVKAFIVDYCSFTSESGEISDGVIYQEVSLKEVLLEKKITATEEWFKSNYVEHPEEEENSEDY